MDHIYYLEARDPVFSSPEKDCIDLVVRFSHLPDEEVPFTASKTDVHAHGRILYARALAGRFGPVGEYDGKSASELAAAQVREDRDRLLAESDGLVARALEAEDPELLARVKAYRQALRDVTTQPGFPENVAWPDKPDL